VKRRRTIRWPRSKDREYLRGVIGVQEGKLDWPYIEGAAFNPS
jgi:hypothetical protein